MSTHHKLILSHYFGRKGEYTVIRPIIVDSCLFKVVKVVIIVKVVKIVIVVKVVIIVKVVKIVKIVIVVIFPIIEH